MIILSDVPEEVKKWYSRLGKISYQKNKDKRDFKAMSKKGLARRWGHGKKKPITGTGSTD